MNYEKNKININNIFDNLLEDFVIENNYYYIKDFQKDNYINIISFFKEKIIKYSNEFLFLIDYYYPKFAVYQDLVDNYKNLNTEDNLEKAILIDENVIMFNTTFSKGTTHGYTAIYNTLQIYFEKYNNEKYKNYKICVYAKSQQGILDLINNFIHKDKIIYLKEKMLYKLKKCIYIENKYHHYFDCHNFLVNTQNFILKNIIIKEDSYGDSKLCIIKNTSNYNNIVTKCGIINNNIVRDYCIKNNFEFLNIEDYTELSYINKIYSAKFLICSWGTSFFKNYIYVSDKCEKILVLILEDYIYEFENYKSIFKVEYLPKKIRNANIYYLVVKNSVDLLTHNFEEIYFNSNLNFYQNNILCNQYYFLFNNFFESEKYNYIEINSIDKKNLLKFIINSKFKITLLENLEPYILHYLDFLNLIFKKKTKLNKIINDDNLNFNYKNYKPNINKLEKQDITNLLKLFSLYYIIEVKFRKDHIINLKSILLDLDMNIFSNINIQKFKLNKNIDFKIKNKYLDYFNLLNSLDKLEIQFKLLFNNINNIENEIFIEKLLDKDGNKIIYNLDKYSKIFKYMYYKNSNLVLHSTSFKNSLNLEKKNLKKKKNKKIAILLAGLSYYKNYTRQKLLNYDINYKDFYYNLKEKICNVLENKYNLDYEIFLSTNESKEQKNIINLYKPKTHKFIIEEIEGKSVKKKIKKILLGLDLIYKEIKIGNLYDYILITRFDIFFLEKLYNINLKKLNLVSILESPNLICDNFYLFPISFLNHYYNIFKNAFESEDLFITHKLLKEFKNKIDINYIKNENVEVKDLSFYKLKRINIGKNLIIIRGLHSKDLNNKGPINWKICYQSLLNNIINLKFINENNYDIYFQTYDSPELDELVNIYKPIKYISYPLNEIDIHNQTQNIYEIIKKVDNIKQYNSIFITRFDLIYKIPINNWNIKNNYVNIFFRQPNNTINDVIFLLFNNNINNFIDLIKNHNSISLHDLKFKNMHFMSKSKYYSDTDYPQYFPLNNNPFYKLHRIRRWGIKNEKEAYIEAKRQGFIK